LKRKYARAKKRLGQNFLYDPAIARKIVAAADLAPGDVVVELGAGRGILTRALLERGVRLIALELDSALHEDLSADLYTSGSGQTASSAGSGLELLNEDFTSVSLGNLLRDRGLDKCALMGNIPYNLTREVLFGYLVDGHTSIDRAVIMVQKEVADRVVSPPGSRVYGITSVILQTLYEVRVALKVAPGSFQPRPKVASSVLHFRPVAQAALGEDELPGFIALVKNVFQQRRKTLQNTLKSFYSLDGGQLDTISQASGVDLGARPEALSKEDFHRLARSLARESKR
jgi:16S rRNA (adenine1518-N6/adenine1519-N6)-dimethyltransferase